MRGKRTLMVIIILRIIAILTLLPVILILRGQPEMWLAIVLTLILAYFLVMDFDEYQMSP
jgi:hypothetical protein